MPDFAANLTFLFTEIPFMERFSAARDAGFQAVEFMFPYDFDMGEIKARLDETGQQLILCNLPAGNWAGGDRGTACNPERKTEFRQGVGRGIEAAKALGADRLNCLVGLKPESLSDQEARETMAENIRFAADALGREGIRLVVEPINRYDMPGFGLNTSARALEIIAQADHPNAYLQLDIYHARREGEDPAAILRSHLGRVGHIQIADCPGRHQPGTGETDFRFLLPEIDRIGYRGYVSLEYIPQPDTLTSLQWMSSYGFRA
ncbi:MAG: hydroxypyruvate isomerase family protein [Thermodesulfobacteriota bacterium]